jgi:hypothetical protein
MENKEDKPLSEKRKDFFSYLIKNCKKKNMPYIAKAVKLIQEEIDEQDAEAVKKLKEEIGIIPSQWAGAVFNKIDKIFGDFK